MRCSQRGLLSFTAAVGSIATVLFFAAAEQAFCDAFQNLDFESADIIGSSHYQATSNAIPGWTVGYRDFFDSTDSGIYSSILYNEMTLAAPSVSIHDSSSRYFLPLQGGYSIVLRDGTGAPDQRYCTYISQTGDISSKAKSLMFRTDGWGEDCVDELQVSLNENVIPFKLYSSTMDGTVNLSHGPIRRYICDISSYSGQKNVVLKFEKTLHQTTVVYDCGFVTLDKIFFSTLVVPEPSSLVLLCLGVVSFFSYRWCRSV